MIGALALAFLFACSVVRAAVDCVSPDGAWDLTPLAGSDLPGNDGSYNYKLQLCGVASESVCAGKGANFCQYTTATPPQYFHFISKWDNSGVWNPCTDPVSCPNGGVQIRFANGEPCGGTGPKRSVTILGSCLAGSTATTYTVQSAAGNCQFTVLFHHDMFCAGGGGSDGGKHSSISPGTVFLIILVVIIPVYVVAGCIYKRQRMGAAGIESCPNIDFWRELPGLISDGFKFTVQKLRACCGGGGGGGGGYETVKEPTLPTL